MTRLPLRLSALAAVLLAASVPPVSGAGARLVDLGTADGGTQSVAYAINNHGQVAGAFDRTDGQYRAFLWKGRGLQRLGTLPGGTNSFARGINDQGQVVGESVVTSGDFQSGHAFLWEHGKLRDLGTLPGGSSSTAMAINRRGRVAGYSDNVTGIMRATRWDHRRIAELGLIGHTYGYAFGLNGRGSLVGRMDAGFDPAGGLSYGAFLLADRPRALPPLPSAQGSAVFAAAYGINDKGQVVGESETGAADEDGFRVRRAVRWDSGRPRDLGTLPGGTLSCAYGINAAGEAVGFSEVACGAYHAVLWAKGKIIDLNTLLPAGTNMVLTHAYGINDRGQIAGQGIVGAESHAFVLTR